MQALVAIFICLLAPCTPMLAQTQLEMNQSAGREFSASDKKLNAVYHQIQRAYAKNPEFLKSLKAAQQAWLKFRDAQLAMMFPPRWATSRNLVRQRQLTLCI